jgi:hypothetical protein
MVLQPRAEWLTPNFCEFYIDLWETISLVYVKVPLGPPNSCSSISVLLCGLVSDCGSTVVRRSSRDCHGFSASLPVAWLHPTLTGIKLVISAIFYHLPLFVHTAVKIRPPTGLSLSFGISFQVFTVDSITISSISYLYFSVHYLIFFIPYP